MNISQRRTDRQQQWIGRSFGKTPYLFIVIVIAGLAVATSACSSSPQASAEVSISPAVIETAVEMPAGEALQLAAPDTGAAQSNEAVSAKAAPIVQSPVQEQNNDSAQPPVEAVQAPGPAVPPADAVQPTASAPVVESAPAESLPPAEAKVGFLAPDLTLTALDGSSIRLADLRGKNVLINYWVTWCIPCMDELPVLSRLSMDYQDQNVAILTVNGIEQDQLAEVQQLVAELGLTQPVLLDEKESFWSTYLVQFLPTSFFIDTQGIIRHIMLGSATEDVIRSKIEQLISNQL